MESQCASPEWTARSCEQCGVRARVQILEGYRSGNPVLRFFCIECADQDHLNTSEQCATNTRQRLSIASTVVLAGACIGLLGAWADRFGIGQSDGFGFRQQAAAAVGVLSVLIGALLRIDVVAVFGTVLFTVAALADVMGLGLAAGTSVTKLIVMLAGICVIVSGLLARRLCERKA